MATRPFKVIIKNGEHIRVDLTDAEIAEAQARQAQEDAERQARDARAAKHALMMAYLEELYDNRPQPAVTRQPR